MDAAGLAGAFPAFAGLMGIPEVANALAGLPPNANANEVIGAVIGTQWWRNTSQTERDWIGLGLSSPAEQQRQANNQALGILQMASSMGIPMSLAQAHDMATDALKNGWSASQLQYNVSARATNADSPGTISATQTNLKGVAASQGINVSDATTFDWAKKIAMGTADQKGFDEWAKDAAIMTHPYWQKQIDQGVTVRQLADPYVQSAAQTLEISPSQVNLADPKWQFAQTDAKGNKTPMALDQWQTKLMTDPAYGWDKTDNAKQAAYNMVDQISKSFGARA